MPEVCVVFWQLCLFGAPATQYLPPRRSPYLLSAMLSTTPAHKITSPLWVTWYLIARFKYHCQRQNSQTSSVCKRFCHLPLKFGFAHFKGYRLNYVKKKFRCVGTLTARRLSLLFFKPSVRCWTTCRASRCCCGSPWSAGPVFRCATRRS